MKVRRGTSPVESAQVGIGFTDVGLWYPIAKGFIRALLNTDPSPRPTAQQALTYSWLTSFAAPTEHDLSGLRENFDPRCALAQCDRRGSSPVAVREL
jgi:hypothetical protein